MPILGICSLQAIGDDSRHVASLTFYPGICRAENISTAETQYHSSSISFSVCTYKYSLTPPPPPYSPPPPSHPTLYTSLHIPISFSQGSFPSFSESAHSIPFHYQSVRAKHSLPFGLRACTCTRCPVAADRQFI